MLRSCGVMLYVMLHGRYPFPGSDHEIIAQITACVWEMPPGISGECQDLLRGMLEKDPSKRMVMVAIEAHPWFLTGLPPNAFESTTSAEGV